MALHGRRQLRREAPTTRSRSASRPRSVPLRHALSREQTNKNRRRCTFRTRLRAQGPDLPALDGGAHMYFCGLKGMMPGIPRDGGRASARRRHQLRGVARGSPGRRASGTSGCTKSSRPPQRRVGGSAEKSSERRARVLRVFGARRRHFPALFLFFRKAGVAHICLASGRRRLFKDSCHH